MRTRDFRKTFEHELRDPEYVREYLCASLQDAAKFDDPNLVQVTLLDVLQARQPAPHDTPEDDSSHLVLYKALSGDSASGFAAIVTTLWQLGLCLSVDRLPNRGDAQTA